MTVILCALFVVIFFVLWYFLVVKRMSDVDGRIDF